MSGSMDESRSDVYQIALVEALQEGRSEETCDVTIQSKDGVPIYAHSAILRQTNMFFDKILEFSTCKAGRYTVHLKDIPSSAITDIIDYLYTGRLDRISLKFLKLVEALKTLEMDDIIDQCLGDMKLDDRTVFELLEQDTSNALIGATLPYIEDNFKALSKTDRMLRLPWRCMKMILSSDKLNTDTEDRVYQLAVAWCEADNIRRSAHVPEVCSLIRTSFITDHGLQNMVCNKNILTNNEEFYTRVETTLGSPDLPSPTEHARVNEKMGKIFVFGGYLNRSQITSTMEVFNRKTGEWEWQDEMPLNTTPPSYHSASSAAPSKDNKIYIAGGQNMDGVRTDATYVFDGKLSIWACVKEMPTVRVKSACARFGHWLYVTGGQKDRHTMSEVLRLNTNLKTWEVCSPMNHARHSHGMVATPTRLFVAGGEDAEGPLATAEMLDPKTDQWTVIAPMSNARFGCALVAFKEQVYATGGWNGRRALHECETYNTENNNWGYIHPMQTRRYGHMATSFGSKIYVLGGQQVPHEDATGSVEEYCAETNTWSRVPDMNSARAWAAAGAVI